MSDEEAQRIREEVIRALAEQGEDVAAFPGADAALAEDEAESVALPAWDGVVDRAAEAGLAVSPDAEGAPAVDAEDAEELTEEEVERRALEAVFAAVRAASAASRLVQPSEWPDEGLVPAHQTPDDWEMFVYEYVEERGAESERAAEEAAPAPAVRTATTTVGVPRFRRVAAATEAAAEGKGERDRASGSEPAPAEPAAEEAAPAPDPDALAEPDAPAPLPEPACADIVALVGAHSYYLYSRDHMTDAYARWAFLAHEDDRIATFVECVRQESRTYPRPMEAAALQNEPFNYSAEDVAGLWEAVHASGAYPDIDTVTASNGDVYYFSTDYLTPSYAASLAEWHAVERSMFL